MSVDLNTYVSCEPIQQALNGKFVDFDPTDNRFVPQFLRVVNSDANTMGVLQNQIDRGDGHKMDVKVTYTPRMQESETSNTPLDACTTGDENGETSTTYEIDNTAGTWAKATVDLTKLIDNCKTDEYFVSKQVRNLIDVVVRSMGTKTVAEAGALFGNHASTGTDTAVTGATKDSSGTWINDLTGKIEYEIALSEIEGSAVFAFGGSQAFREWQTNVGYNCCTGAYNVDLNAYNETYGPALVFDKRIAKATVLPWGDADSVGVMVPGALQLLTYNQNRGANGIREINTGTDVVGTLLDPISGILFDYEATYNCKKWTFSVGVAHQLVAMPADMFSGGDDLEGVNYFYNFTIDNP